MVKVHNKDQNYVPPKAIEKFWTRKDRNLHKSSPEEGYKPIETKIAPGVAQSEKTKRTATVVAAVCLAISTGLAIYFGIHPVGSIVHTFTLPVSWSGLTILTVRLTLTFPLLLATVTGLVSLITFTVSLATRQVENIYLNDKEFKDFKFEVDRLNWHQEESSLKRRAYEAACGPFNILRTLRDYSQIIDVESLENENLNKNSKNHDDDSEEGDYTIIEGQGDQGLYSEFRPIAKTALNQKRQIGPDSIRAICGVCIEKAKENNKAIVLIENFSSNLATAEIEKLKGRNVKNEEVDPDLVLFPVVLKGLVDHIVAVVYDKDKNRVELYDPKGLTSNDYSNNIRSKDKINLAGVVRKVAETYGDENTTIWENTTKHQYDSHNCGVYVSKYFQNRVEGKTVEQAAGQDYSYKNVDSLRIELINLIK